MRGFLSSQAPPSTSTLRATLPSQKHAYVVTKKTLSWIFKHSERRYRYILWRFPMRSCTQIHSLAYGLRLNSRSRTSVNISAFLIHLPECEASRFTISLDLSFYQALKEFLFIDTAQVHSAFISPNQEWRRIRYGYRWQYKAETTSPTVDICPLAVKKAYQTNCHVRFTIRLFHKHEFNISPLQTIE